jgi:ATP-dependent protease ClpP protease subunit
MNLKYVHNYINSDTATMNIYSEVGGLFGVNGGDFANEMQYLSAIGYKTINIHINSPGGSVLDGQSIAAMMRRLNNEGQTEVNTYVDYMAASIAGVIAMYGKKKYIASNGLFMMHDPSGGGNSKKDREILDKIKVTLAEQLASASNKDVSEVMNLMSKETWMDASEAIDAGFFDEKFDAMITVKNECTDLNELYAIANKLLTKKEIKMERVINLLKLSNDAGEDIIFDAVEGVQKENTDLVQKNAELEQSVIDKDHEIEELKNELAKRDNEKIESFVNKLVEEGKIKADGKENAMKAAKADFEAFKNFTSSLVVAETKSFRNVIGASASSAPQGRDAWTLRDWEKKDPKGLENMYNENPEEYQALYDRTYKK